MFLFHIVVVLLDYKASRYLAPVLLAISWATLPQLYSLSPADKIFRIISCGAMAAVVMHTERLFSQYGRSANLGTAFFASGLLLGFPSSLPDSFSTWLFIQEIIPSWPFTQQETAYLYRLTAYLVIANILELTLNLIPTPEVISQQPADQPAQPSTAETLLPHDEQPFSDQRTGGHPPRAIIRTPSTEAEHYTGDETSSSDSDSRTAAEQQDEKVT